MANWCGKLEGEEPDYLEEIESAYSRCRERYSMLSAIDWDLAAGWERDGIPLFIAIRAIDDCCRKYKARREPGKINTLRYFDQAVRAAFSAWSASRVGAHDPGRQDPSSGSDHQELPPMCDKCRPHLGQVLTLVDPDAEFSWDREQLRPCPDCNLDNPDPPDAR